MGTKEAAMGLHFGTPLRSREACAHTHTQPLPRQCRAGLIQEEVENGLCRQELFPLVGEQGTVVRRGYSRH